MERPLTLRSAQSNDSAVVQTIRERSLTQDAPLRPPSWAPLSATWGSVQSVLEEGGRAIGVVDLRLPDAAGGIAEGHVAMDPDQRRPEAVRLLIDCLERQARAAGASRLRIRGSGGAVWLEEELRSRGFSQSQMVFHMRRPPDAGTPTPLEIAGLAVRQLRPGEEGRLLDALNAAWCTTPNFHPITPGVLARDLEGQRDGMFLGLETSGSERIAATCHAILPRPYSQEPTLGWISNVTTIPDWRGRGAARALLRAGLIYLLENGCREAGLGVRGDNEHAIHLYESEGFRVVHRRVSWETALT